jgi:hypothetical protein
MSKSLLTILAGLALLLAAAAFGRQAPSRGAEPRGPALTTRASAHAHARGTAHASMHDRTSIDDDDAYDDDDDVEVAMLAPPQHDAKDSPSDAKGDASATNSVAALATTAAAQHPTRQGIRLSGEHRSAADRPPRS